MILKRHLSCPWWSLVATFVVAFALSTLEPMEMVFCLHDNNHDNAAEEKDHRRSLVSSSLSRVCLSHHAKYCFAVFCRDMAKHAHDLHDCVSHDSTSFITQDMVARFLHEVPIIEFEWLANYLVLTKRAVVQGQVR